MTVLCLALHSLVSAFFAHFPIPMHRERTHTIPMKRVLLHSLMHPLPKHETCYILTTIFYIVQQTPAVMKFVQCIVCTY